MYLGYKNIQRLEDNQIAGPVSLNPIADFVNGIRTTTGDYIELNPNKNDSIDIDLNVAAILSLIPDALTHSFKCEISGTSVKCSAGTVHMPDRTISISAKSLTSCHDGYMMYVKLTGTPASVTGQLVYDNNFAGMIVPATGNDPDTCCLPIATTEHNSSGYKIVYRHVGDFILSMTPYFWIGQFDKTVMQSLDHGPNGGYIWNTYGECE